MKTKISKINFSKYINITILIICIIFPITNYSHATEPKQENAQISGSTQSTSTDAPTSKTSISTTNSEPLNVQINSTSDGNDNSANKTENNKRITLYSKADILLDAKTGNILYDNHSSDKLYPASTTKLMTAILTMESCNLADSVTIQKDWLKGIPPSYTTAALQPGETLTVEQLMHVLLIPSANDAANALACHISGSIDNFATKMNEKAIELGCKNTHFVNPSGVHNDDHYSTAYDMAIIGKYALKFDTIKQIALMQTYSLPDLPNGSPRNFKSTNTLINQKNQYYYEYATGLKTGYTDKAKSCIVATAKKDDIELICVVLGGEKNDDRKAQRELDCKTLFEYGFNNFKYTDVCAQNSILDKTQTTDVPQYLQNSEIIYSDSLNILVPTDETISSTVNFEQEKDLPIQKNTVVGTITYHVDGKDYTVNLLNSSDIMPDNSNSIKIVFYLLIGFLILFIFITGFKRKHKSKDTKYFRHSFY